MDARLRYVMSRVDDLVDDVVRRLGARRGRVCPCCKGRKLERLATAMWTGIPGTMLCDTYRCRSCGEELFAERYGVPMTMAEHAAWREAKQMRLFEPERGALPSAVVLRDRSQR